jgi:hypothetical protein
MGVAVTTAIRIIIIAVERRARPSQAESIGGAGFRPGEARDLAIAPVGRE